MSEMDKCQTPTPKDLIQSHHILMTQSITTSEPLKFGRPLECLADSKIRARTRTSQALVRFGRDNGYVGQNLTGYRAIAAHYLKPETAIRGLFMRSRKNLFLVFT